MTDMPFRPSSSGVDVDRRLAALERQNLTPRYPGELVPYSGPIPGGGGEQEIQPGFLLANGADVPLNRWPELAVMLGLYGSASSGYVRLPSPTTLGSTSAWLIYGGRKASEPAAAAGIVPTVFTVATSADDGHVEAISGVWRPAAGTTAYTTTSQIIAYNNAGYNNTLGFVRFDTSAIPGTQTILTAALRIYIIATASANARNITADWYDAGSTITTADYTATVGTNACAGVTIASFAIGLNDIALLNPDANINRTGYTGLRLFVDGAAPTGENYIQFRAADYAPGPRPQLLVTYP
jgi:hypothetical protein